MVDRLIFHLGDRKTGSTALQKTLAQGLWSAPGAPRLAYMAKDHNGPLAQVLTDLGDGARAARRFSGLGKRLANVTAPVAVVSSESFEDVAPQALRRAIDTHLPDYADRVELVAYARPHEGRVLSGYAEQVRRGQTLGTLEEFVAEGLLLDRFTMADRFARWRAVFGDAFTLRPVVRGHLAGGDVVTDFLTLVLDRPATLTWEGRANRSPTAPELAALRVIHGAWEAAGWGPGRLSGAGVALAERLAGGASGPKLTLPRALAADLAQICADDARALDGFFDGTPMADALASMGAGDPMSQDPQDWFGVEGARILAALAAEMAGAAQGR